MTRDKMNDLMPRYSTLWLLVLSPCLARADGGTLCLLERANGYQVAVFTSPTPLRAGPVDISVLVQDTSTREQVPGARVVIRLRRREATGRAPSCTFNDS